MLETSSSGVLAGAVLAVLGLYLLFGPIEKLARKPSPVKSELRSKISSEDVPAWMKVFFRGLGILLLVFAGLLLAPVIRPVDEAPTPERREVADAP